MSSRFCCSALRPAADGQSILTTVAIHTPRNSRLGSISAGGSGRPYAVTCMREPEKTVRKVKHARIYLISKAIVRGKDKKKAASENIPRKAITLQKRHRSLW